MTPSKKSELAAEIAIRNHATLIINTFRGFTSKEEVKLLNAYISMVDKKTVASIVAGTNSVEVKPVAPSKKDLDMAEARAKMRHEKDFPAQVERKVEEVKPTPKVPTTTKKKKAKTKAKVAPKVKAPKSVVKRVLD